MTNPQRATVKRSERLAENLQAEIQAAVLVRRIHPGAPVTPRRGGAEQFGSIELLCHAVVVLDKYVVSWLSAKPFGICVR